METLNEYGLKFKEDLINGINYLINLDTKQPFKHSIFNHVQDIKILLINYYFGVYSEDSWKDVDELITKLEKDKNIVVKQWIAT